ncbi:hypothetical protein XENOCAPTIV_028082, partial [Xenoophorus captivus]
AVDGVPPLPLPVRGQEAKERKREAARHEELLLPRAEAAADLRRVLKLTVAAENYTE